jgi:hypothetical protein
VIDELTETKIVVSDRHGNELLIIVINRLAFKDIDEETLLDEILPDLKHLLDGPVSIDIYEKKRTQLH